MEAPPRDSADPNGDDRGVDEEPIQVVGRLGCHLFWETLDQHVAHLVEREGLSKYEVHSSVTPAVEAPMRILAPLDEERMSRLASSPSQLGILCHSRSGDGGHNEACSEKVKFNEGIFSRCEL